MGIGAPRALLSTRVLSHSLGHQHVEQKPETSHEPTTVDMQCVCKSSLPHFIPKAGREEGGGGARREIGGGLAGVRQLGELYEQEETIKWGERERGERRETGKGEESEEIEERTYRREERKREERERYRFLHPCKDCIPQSILTM